MTSKGHIQPGYSHIREQLDSGSAFAILTALDVLNRYPYISENATSESTTSQKNDLNTAKVLMYILPRQFGLHNVFTSTVDPKTTVQKFQDYTVRDDEIASHLRSDRKFLDQGVPKIPKRLRGGARDLVRRLQIRHGRCSYFELLRHYCPSLLDALREKAKRNKTHTPTSKTAASEAPHDTPSQGPASTEQRATQMQNRMQGPRVFQIDPSIPIVDLATPVAHVSAFLQAALSKIVPDAFLGEGDDLVHNKALLAKKLHHFIALRRFEMMSLHELSQGFKVLLFQEPHAA